MSLTLKLTYCYRAGQLVVGSPLTFSVSYRHSLHYTTILPVGIKCLSDSRLC
jgi:hypothetical protein